MDRPLIDRTLERLSVRRFLFLGYTICQYLSIKPGI